MVRDVVCSVASCLLLIACGTSGSNVDAGDEPDATTDATTRRDAGLAPGRQEVSLPPCSPNTDSVPTRPALDAPPTLPQLRVLGRRIIDDEGEDVALRGTNFGAWLQAETWLSAYGREPGPDDCTNTHAPCFHDLLVEDWRAEAERRGLLADFDWARGRTQIEWLTIRFARWPIVQSWRDAMWARGLPNADAIEDFWAYVDGQPWVFEEESLWALLSRRFGEAEAERLRRTHQAHFITEVDMERVAALGLNVVRVPFWHQNLETDDGHRATYRAEGFELLDRVARWARTHGVYLILDMHGAAGGQSHYDHQGLRNGGSLWTRSECVERAASLWQALARYFRDDPHVLAYDLLNEPAAGGVERYARVHTALYEAIREVDPEHIITIEDGYQGVEGVRSPSELGFTQTIWQIHEYPTWTSAQDFADKIMSVVDSWWELTERFDAPILMGEFSSEATGPDGSPAAMPLRVEAMDRAIRAFNERGVHWTTWTWKSGGRADSVWGVYHPTTSRWIDLTTQDADGIARDFEATQSETWEPLEPFAAVLAARAADPLP